MQEDNGFLHHNGTTQDLGDLLPFAINDEGTIVGGRDAAFIYRDGHAKVIAAGRAFDINNRGDVVGKGDTADRGAFVYNDGIIRYLDSLIDPDLGLRLSEAVAINDFGQIAANGITPDGDSHAFLLTPVPEPTALSGVLLGVMLVIRRRRAI